MKNILTERQLTFLDAIRKESSFAKQFCLTGGTALAGFYLFHRYSEDLDFFSEEEVDARIKFDWHIDPLQLETQFIKAEEAADFPRMIYALLPEDWRNFYREEAKKLKSEILKV